MIEITDLIEILPSEVDAPEYPSYDKVGRILVTVSPTDSTVYNHEYDVHDFDHDSSVFHINEGVGFDYWLDGLDFPTPGTYVVEGITGEYIRGNWSWGEDDDESWDFKEIRLATPEEISSKVLS